MYIRPRIIPCLLLDENQGLVKTTRFKKPRYIGDPVNAVKIFNNKSVDELCILDISATKLAKSPPWEVLKDIASEAFMPLSYGGGVSSLEDVKKLLSIGYEKIIFNTALIENPRLIRDAISALGGQSIVASIDVKSSFVHKQFCYVNCGQEKTKYSPVELAKIAEQLGVGEILLNSIDNDGMMEGYDLDLVRTVVESVSVPVIACGGAGSLEDVRKVLQEANAHAAAAGSIFVYYGRNKAILITYPGENALFHIGII